MNKFIVILLVSLFVTSCGNTVSGVGRDLQIWGDNWVGSSDNKEK